MLQVILKSVIDIVKKYPWLILFILCILYILYLQRQLERKDDRLIATVKALNTIVKEKNNIYSKYVVAVNKIRFEKEADKELEKQVDDLKKLVKSRNERITQLTRITMPERIYEDFTPINATVETLKTRQLKISFVRDYTEFSVFGYTLYPPAQVSLKVVRKPMELRLITTIDDKLKRMYITGVPLDSTMTFSSEEAPSLSIFNNLRERLFIDLSVKAFNRSFPVDMDLSAGFKIWRISPLLGASIYEGKTINPFIGLRIKLL